MGLLDTLMSAYERGSGLLAPNQLDVEARPEIAKNLLSLLPGSGDAISGYDAYQSARNGEWGDAALNGVGLLPFVPSMAGVVRHVIPVARTKMPITYTPERWTRELEQNQAVQDAWVRRMNEPLENPFSGDLYRMIEEQRKGMPLQAQYVIDK